MKPISKTLLILGLAYLQTAFAISADSQTVLSIANEKLLDVIDAGTTLKQDGVLKEKLRQLIDGGSEKEFIQQNGFVYEIVSHPGFAEYQLRVREPRLCDPSVQQYSGYLDIGEDRHFFFWFFESRTSPKDDPLVLWLNGGPGCSSTTGLLFELGPCNIAEDGNSTTHNPYSWNTHANMIFLDQLIDVGYSYASNTTDGVNNTAVAAIDVYAFLQIFVNRFTKYGDLPFHIAAESYGGAFAPHIASVIHKKNKDVVFAASGLKTINLKSVIIGNGLTDPLVQMPSAVEFGCDSPFAVLDSKSPQCTAMRLGVPVCEQLIRSCYRFDSCVTCAPAALSCWGLYTSLFETGLNIYDMRKTCDRRPDRDGLYCYKELLWVEHWMNDPMVKHALGVDPARNYVSCNLDVNQAFMRQGDGMRNSAALLPELINDGIRLLVYAGNYDLMCNFIGEERWLTQLNSKFHDEFVSAVPALWMTIGSGKMAGVVRSAGGGGLTAGNVTFVNVWDAGHMVPHDQPEAAFDLITRWIMDVPMY